MVSFNQAGSTQVLNNCLSVQTAAFYSGYSLQYLRRLLRTRKLEGIKIAGVWLVDKSTLDVYVESAQKIPDRRFGPK